jgi:peptidyl-prolyl cis-trans isomerase D
VRRISRSSSEGLTPQALATVMQLPAAKLPAYVGVTLDNDSYGVLRVLSAIAPDKPDLNRRNQVRQTWLQQSGAADDNAYLEALKLKYKARVLKEELKPTEPDKNVSSSKE